MRVKYVIGLLTAIILTVAPAFAQQPAPAPPQPPDDLANSFSIFVDGGGFLGVHAEDITNENMGRYRLNQPRGVGITQVVKDSPAEKAGLRKDDVILRLDGENVTSVRKLNRLVSEIAPDHSVRITISRNGAEQELTATIGKRHNSSTVRDLFPGRPRVWKFETQPFDRDKFPFNRDNFPFGGDPLDDHNDLTLFFGTGRRIGVNSIALTQQLADYFGIANRRGVLVTSVSDDGPAAKAGIKAGDVITAIDGEAVDSPGDLARIINRKKEGDVSLTVVRNKNQQTFRVTPAQGGSRVLGRPQAGRQIVIPRIKFPNVNISGPSINIELPTIEVNVPIRVRRGVYGPI